MCRSYFCYSLWVLGFWIISSSLAGQTGKLLTDWGLLFRGRGFLFHPCHATWKNNLWLTCPAKSGLKTPGSLLHWQRAFLKEVSNQQAFLPRCAGGCASSSSPFLEGLGRSFCSPPVLELNRELSLCFLPLVLSGSPGF